MSENIDKLLGTTAFVVALVAVALAGMSFYMLFQYDVLFENLIETDRLTAKLLEQNNKISENFQKMHELQVGLNDGFIKDIANIKEQLKP